MPIRDNNSDFYATDEEDAAPSARASSSTLGNSRKRRATNAPTHTAPRVMRQRRAENVSPSPPASAWAEVKAIGGSCPPLNCNSSLVDDPCNHRVFVVGGLRPDDKNCIPSSDFWFCDTSAMAWTNLTNELVFRIPDAPFSREELHPTKTPLPRLTLPGCCLVRIEGRSFIYLIGGFDADLDKPSARVIVVDPDRPSWWYLKIEGDPVCPRIHPAVAFTGDNVYIFGGYACFVKEYEEGQEQEQEEQDCEPCNSFSVLAYNPDNRNWHWKIRDRSYNLGRIPKNHPFGAAIPVYGGKKVLLFPGRHSESTHRAISYHPKQIYSYHIGNDNFQRATRDFAGNFPQNLWWHCSFEYLRPAGGHTVNGGPNTIQYSSSASPSVIIGGWIEFQDALVPELWRLALSPEDRIHCLNLAQHIWNLNHNFQSLILAEGRLRLLGSEQNEGPEQVIDAYVDLPV